MENKSAMLEAVKRKRYSIQHQSENTSDHAEGEGSDTDGELAPESGSSTKDVLLGKPGGKNAMNPAENHIDSENETAEGQDGFPNISHKSPSNSKNLFQNPKKDTHDPVDLNKDNNMAGSDGESNQHDEMGVDVHKNVREQSSKMAMHNAHKAEAIKNSSRKNVKSDMDIPDVVPSHGEDNPDASPDEQVNDKPRLSGMKGARAKLDGYLSKFKK